LNQNRTWAYGVKAGGQCVALIIIALTGGAVFRYWNSSGYLDDPTMLAGIRDYHWAGFLPEVDAQEVEGILDDDNVILVDARPANDFDAGHLAEAINIEPKTDPAHISRRLSQQDRGKRIVVYCQFDGCGYSALVARRLHEAGFHNLSLFPGGWAEWVEYTKKTSDDLVTSTR
jgi:rhodanese-related sulfurtransferase